MKWPLAPAAVCLALGIVIGDVMGGYYPIPLVVAVVLLVLARHYPVSRKRLLIAALFFLGWSSLLWHTEIRSPLDLRVYSQGEPALATLEGELTEAPREYITETRRGPVQRFSAVVAVGRIQLHGEWQQVSGRIYVRTPVALPAELHQGSRVEISGLLQKPPGPAAQGLFDFHQYLARRGIWFELQTAGLADWQIKNADGQRAPWPMRFREWARATLQSSLPAEDESVQLLQAMCLGWRTGLTQDVAEPFQHSGTVHLFAVSGLHIGLIAFVLVEFLLAVGFSRRLCAVILIPLLWFYTAAIGWQPSAMRASVMMTIVGMGWVLERPANLLNSLAAAACMLLLLDPQQLFQSGFQLSFMVVLSIGLLLPPIEGYRQKLFRPDPLLPEELRPRWQRWLDGPVRYVTLLFTTSLAAWLGSLPLIALGFHLLTPVALIANVCIVPLGTLAMMSSLGCLLTAWCAPLSDLFAHSAWGLMNLMTWLSLKFSALPGGWWYVAIPGVGVLISYYVLLLTAFAVEWKLLWRWRLAGVGALALAMFLATGWMESRNVIGLTLLDVSGGDAHWFAGGRSYPSLQIDAGSEGAYDYALKPFLQSRGINRVNSLLLTHGDTRHVGGAAKLLAEFHPRELITSPVPSRSPGYRQVVKEWDARQHAHTLIQAGTNLGPWRVLHPARSDYFSSGDDNAVVLLGEFYHVRVLLLSDLGKSGQQAMLERNKDLRADIVVTGLPAKNEPLSDDLLAVIKPQMVIVSCARQPAGEQASRELRARLDRGPWHTLWMSDCGTVDLRFHAEGCEVRTMHGAHVPTVKPRSE